MKNMQRRFAYALVTVVSLSAIAGSALGADSQADTDPAMSRLGAGGTNIDERSYAELTDMASNARFGGKEPKLVDRSQSSQTTISGITWEVARFADGTGACVIRVVPGATVAEPPLRAGGCAAVDETPFSDSVVTGPDGLVVTGLTRDDVTSITIITRDGARHAATIDNNTFTWRGAGWEEDGIPASISVSNGTEQWRLDYPDDYSPRA
jgi:hypothetical protein